MAEETLDLNKVIETVKNKEEKIPITDEEIDQLLSFTKSEDEKTLELVYETFGDLARKEINRDPMRNKNILELCENILSTSNLKLRSMAIRTIANLCFNHDVTCEMVKEESIKILCDTLAEEDELASKVSAGCLANIASSNEQAVSYASSCGAITQLLKNIDRDDSGVVLMSLKALNNFSISESANYEITTQGGMTKIIKKFLLGEIQDESVTAEAISTIQSLCDLKNNALTFIEELKGFETLLDLVNKTKDDEDFEDVAIAALNFLYGLAENDDTRKAYESVDIHDNLLDIHKSTKSLSIQEKVLKTVAQLSLSDIIAKKLLSYVDTFMEISSFDLPQNEEDEKNLKNRKEIQLSALMILSNMIRDDATCKAMMEKGLDKILLARVSGDQDFRIKHMAASALKNLAILHENKLLLLKRGVMKDLVELSKAKDDVVIYPAISTIKTLLAAGEIAAEELLKYDEKLENIIKLTCYVDGETRRSDHVFYESSRIFPILCNISEKYTRLIIDAKDGLQSIVNLLLSNFDILREEGDKALNKIREISPEAAEKVLSEVKKEKEKKEKEAKEKKEDEDKEKKESDNVETIVTSESGDNKEGEDKETKENDNVETIVTSETEERKEDEEKKEGDNTEKVVTNESS